MFILESIVGQIWPAIQTSCQKETYAENFIKIDLPQAEWIYDSSTFAPRCPWRFTLNIEILYLYDKKIQKNTPGTHINANDKYPQMTSCSKQTYS